MIKRQFHFNIRRRILLSFSLILIISILFTVFNLWTLNTFNNSFKAFHQVSNDTNLMLKIDHDLSELQRNILIFSESRYAKVASFEQLNASHRKMVHDIQLLIDQHTFKKHANLNLLKQMQTSVNHFSEKFNNLNEQRELRRQLVSQQLAHSFDNVDTELLAFSTDFNFQNQHQFMQQYWQARLNLVQSKAESASYFKTHEFKKKQQVEALLGLTKASLQKMREQIKNSVIRRAIDKLDSKLQTLKADFNLAVQVDRNYLFLTNIVIAGESAELNILAQQLKALSLEEQDRIASSLESSIQKNISLALFASLLSIVLVAIVAVLMSRFISQPLTRITETFARLSQGKSVTTIPGVDREDEIGDLARAASVFNQNNLRTKALLVESESMTKALEYQEANLKRKVEELDNFTHIASHDLKSPIQGIASLAYWVEEDLGDDISAVVKNNLERIRVRVALMENLIDDLLRYSKSGKVSDEVSVVHVQKMIEEVLGLLEVPKGLQVTVQADVKPIETQKTPLQTSLRNLIANAIKHHDKADGTIDIHVTDKGNHYWFEIKDNGPGIPDSEVNMIFLLFRTGSNKKKSTGMGLAFCRRMVEAHHGRIEVETAEGVGTTFRIIWPKNPA